MLKARVVTAAGLLGVFLSALFLLPTGQFAILIAVVVAIGSFEWAGLAKVSRKGRLAFSAGCTGLFVVVIWLVQAIDPARASVATIYSVSALFWVVAAPVWMVRGARIESLALTLAVGTVVVVPTGLSIVSMHYVGPGALLMLLALVWVADTAAYFSGRAFGRHKLAPTISPGKTWEGAVGAVAATLLYAALCAWLWLPLSGLVEEYGWIPYLAISGLLCIVSIEGDLFESSVKRHAGVKDSGNLLPGHGGVLDRIDSLTSTLPLAALIFHVVARAA